MICGLLESCGRFLYRNGDSHQKTKLLLDQLKKKKQAKALDARLNSQVGIEEFLKFKIQKSTDVSKTLNSLFLARKHNLRMQSASSNCSSGRKATSY